MKIIINKSFFVYLRLFALIILTVTATFAASGDLDNNFQASAYKSTNGAVGIIEEQADGKVVIAGSFNIVNGISRNGIARLNVDGSIDNTFNPPDFSINDALLGSGIQAIKIQTDGKILVGGSFNIVNGEVAPGLRRLNSDGSLDSSFFLPIPFNSLISDIEFQSNGKILIGGSFSLANTGYQNLARLNPDGSIDNSFPLNFNGNVNRIEIQNDDKILVGSSILLRLNSDGSNDPTFAVLNTDGLIQALEIQSDGKVLIGGTFQSINGSQFGRIARFLTDGLFDPTFNLNLTGANGAVHTISIVENGKILIGGIFTLFNGISREKVALLNENGSPDNSFIADFDVNDDVFAVEKLNSGKVLVGYKGINTGALALFDENGIPDPNTKFIVGFGGIVRDIIVQTNGKIIAAGDFDVANSQARKSIARYNADGSLDPGFIPFFTDPVDIYSIAIQPDEKILVGTSTTVFRLFSNGLKDIGFTSGNFSNVRDMFVLPDGKILICGDNFIRRLNTDGTLDASFNPPQPDGSVRKMYVQSDGKIWIVGSFRQISVFIRNRIAKLNENGTVDGSFNPPGGADGVVNDIDLQPDGKPIIVGLFFALNGNINRRYIGRYNPDGSLDNTFTPNIDTRSYAVKIQPNGKVLVGGETFSDFLFNPRPGLLRLNSNGVKDPSFKLGESSNETVHRVNLQNDGKILVGGEFTKFNKVSTPLIARLLNDSASIKRTMFDFDGDGKADVSVFRPSNNFWYALLSGGSQVLDKNFGLSGDIPAPADFDGDGKTDLAIFRPSTGSWWYLSSVDNTQKTVQFGAAGDIPLPSDINGDGIDDFVLFRPSNNVWYRAISSIGTVSQITFGTSGDKPIIGDFDGDGKADPAIFRPSTGQWWYQSSVDNSQSVNQWGVSTDIPVPADYDGDGITDLAVFRPSNGGWYILNSSTGQATILGFGVSTDKPVAADYDGDGKADIAVFRPSTGIWYLQRSRDGFTGLQFGVETDIPVPNVFIR